jgi:hypothetical protein
LSGPHIGADKRENEAGDERNRQERATEKPFVIPSGAKNLSFFSGHQIEEGFLGRRGDLGMTNVARHKFRRRARV